ncbi:hypothetical protein JYU02_00080 [bacterium AH-315-P15]|nr:hypothetical protein [bacterium AH-315-P15]
MAKIKISGEVKLTALKTALEETTAAALDEIGARAVEMIREELEQGARSGKLVTRNGRLHRGSAPGEPPASWSGALAASLGYKVEGNAVHVVSGEPYGAYLEYGTMEIAPRPFIGPVMQRLAPEIEAILSRAFEAKGQSK